MRYSYRVVCQCNAKIIKNRIVGYSLSSLSKVFHFLSYFIKRHIVSIYKKYDTSNPCNYRGIIIVNTIAKIFILALHNQLNSWSKSENVLDNTQLLFGVQRLNVMSFHCVIADLTSVHLVSSMTVFDFTEFSDNSPVNFTLRCKPVEVRKIGATPFNRIKWDRNDLSYFNQLFHFNSANFENLTQQLVPNKIGINELVGSCTSLVQNISFSSFEKRVCIPASESPKSVWFKSKCKEAKASFCRPKRRYARSLSDMDKVLFLQE